MQLAHKSASMGRRSSNPQTITKAQTTDRVPKPRAKKNLASYRWARAAAASDPQLSSSRTPSKVWQVPAYCQEFQPLPPTVLGERFADEFREWHSYSATYARAETCKWNC